jgi:hypothetical protein
MGILVKRPRLVLVHPDPDQVAREVVALRQTVERFAAQEFLNDKTLEIDAGGSVSCHGLSSFKSPAPRSN